jgi:RNA polymerase sigma factor FliA
MTDSVDMATDTAPTASAAAPAGRSEDQLVRDHLPLVQYGVAEVAGRIPRHVSRDDLTSAAMFGLAQAARTYDESRGIAFDRYAMIRIRGALLDELRGRDWASRSVRVMARKVDAATDALTVSLGRTPTLEETAAQIGVPVDAVRKAADDVHRATVLNYESLVLDGSGEDLLPTDEASPEQALAERERRAYLRDAVTALPERLRHVVIGYFFEERPMQEIADELGVSESRISQMRGEALELLKAGMDANLSPELLPAEPRPDGRLAKRKAAYYAAVAAASDFRTRLDAAPATVQQRVAASA